MAEGIISTAQAATPSVSDNINGIYRSNFGRPADAEGLAYWAESLKQNPNMDLGAAIRGGAQTQDKAAMTDIGNGGIDLSNTWQTPLDASGVAGQKDVWDSNANKWIAAPTAATQAASPHATPQSTAAPVNMNASELAASQARAATSTFTPRTLVAPTKWDVTADQTVQGQMVKILDPNSPYYQQWVTAGKAAALSNGFSNGSLMQTGILDSVMRGATPIATVDAGTYAKAAGYNADQENQTAYKQFDADTTAGLTNAGQTNDMTKAIIASAMQKYGIDIGASTSRYGTDVNASTSKEIAASNNATSTANTAATNLTARQNTTDNNATSIANTNATIAANATVQKAHDENSTLIANNQAAGTAYANFQNAVATILTSTTMDAAAKGTAIAVLKHDFDARMADLKKGGATVAGPSTIDTATYDAGAATTGAAAGAATTGGDTSGVGAAIKDVGGVDVSGIWP